MSKVISPIHLMWIQLMETCVIIKTERQLKRKKTATTKANTKAKGKEKQPTEENETEKEPEKRKEREDEGDLATDESSHYASRDEERMARNSIVEEEIFYPVFDYKTEMSDPKF